MAENSTIISQTTEFSVINNDNITTVRRKPTAGEIFLPAYALLCVCFIGIILMVTLTRHSHLMRFKKKNKVENWEFELTHYYQIKVVKEARGDTDGITLDNLDVQPERAPFLSQFDKEVIQSLKGLYNNCGDILTICIPALVTLFVGPFLMIFYYSIRDCFWTVDKYPVLPNINQCVACFLTPAGLVYAISFGFAFQQALSKQNDILIKMTDEISILDQTATLATKVKLDSKKSRMKIMRAIKSEAIYMICQIQKKTASSFKYKPTEDYKVDVWTILDYLRRTNKNCSPHYVDKVITKNIIHYISQLNCVCSDQVGVLHSKLHWLKWCFLVTLGFFSLFGVLMIQAYSYRMELMMSTLTLVSVSMLCYIVADLDSPFSGFFRIDVSIIVDVINRLEVLHKMTSEGFEETYNFPDSSKFKSSRIGKPVVIDTVTNNNTDIIQLQISSPNIRRSVTRL